MTSGKGEVIRFPGSSSNKGREKETNTMRRCAWLLLLLFSLALPSDIYAGETLSSMDEDTTPEADDLIYVVDTTYPFGERRHKVQLGNLHVIPDVFCHQDTDCSDVIDEGLCCWDTDDDLLYIGTSVAPLLISNPFGPSIDDTELTAEDFGDFTCTGLENGCTLDADTVGTSEIDTTDFTCADLVVTDCGAIRAASFEALTGPILNPDRAGFGDADDTPSVSGGNQFSFGSANTATVTDFDDWQNGQYLFLHFNGSGTTIDFSAGNILGNDGKKWHPTAYDHMICWHNNTYWHCFPEKQITSAASIRTILDGSEEVDQYTGTGKLVFATSPTFTTPNIGSATGSVSGNAGTATALAADPTDCSANQYATGIAADGDLTCAGIADADIPSGITRDTEWDTWAEHPALTSAYLLVGNASNQAAAVALSGDATISNAGVLSIASGVIGRAEIDETLLSIQTHATDCTALTCDAASDGELCFEQDADAIYVCDGSGSPTWEEISGGGGGASAFLDLSDVDPATYEDEAGKFVRVNAGEDGLEFATVAGTGTMTTVQVGDSTIDTDIVTLDFAADAFEVTEDPATEVNITLDVTPTTGNATLVIEQDAVQVKYATTYLTEGGDGLDLTVAKDIVTTAPITGGTDNVLPGADGDITIALTLEKDLVTTSPLTGGTDNILPGSDADVTIALTMQGDIVAGTGLTGGANDVLPGADADVTLSIATGGITEAMLDEATGTPTDEYCLTYEAGTSNFAWQPCNAGTTMEDMTSGTAWGTYYANADKEMTRLALPALGGKVLTSNTGPAAPSWEDPTSAASGVGAGLVQFSAGGIPNLLDGDSKFMWDDTNKLLGVGDSATNGLGRLQVIGANSDGTDSTIRVLNNYTNAYGAYLTLEKWGSAIGGIVDNGDNVGGIMFKASDGADSDVSVGSISMWIDGSPAANDMPAEMRFRTTPDGSATTQLALVLDSTGETQVQMGLSVQNGATSGGYITMYEDTDSANDYYTKLLVGTQTQNVTYTLPPDDGDSGEQLTTNGSGVLTWEAAGAGGGATAWDDIGDPDADGTVAFAGYEQVITTSLDEAGHVALKIDHTDADVTAATTLFQIQSVDDADADLTYLKIVDDSGSTPNTVFSIGADGATTITGLLTANGGVTLGTGDHLTLGSTQWDVDGSDKIDGEQIADNTIDEDSVDWGSGAGQIDLADIPGGTAGASAFNFGGVSTFEIWNSTSDMTLDTAGQIGINLADDQLVFHGGASGEIQGEAALSLLKHISFSFDPAGYYDQESTYRALHIMRIGDDAPEGITITEWRLAYVGGNPTTEFAGDLICDTTPDYNRAAGATVMDALDTTDGASTADSGFDSATCANGAIMYIDIDSDPTDANVMLAVDIWYYAEED